MRANFVDALLWAAVSGSVAASSVNYSQYVNPFVGGSGPFNGLACASVPYFLFCHIHRYSLFEGED
jgi:hypothetical protein